MKKVKFAAGMIAVLAASLMLVTACDKQEGILTRMSEIPTPPTPGRPDTLGRDLDDGGVEGIIVLDGDTLARERYYPKGYELAFAPDTTWKVSGDDFKSSSAVVLTATTVEATGVFEAPFTYNKEVSDVDHQFVMEGGDAGKTFAVKGKRTFWRPTKVLLFGKKEWKVGNRAAAPVQYTGTARSAQYRAEDANYTYLSHDFAYESGKVKATAHHVFAIAKAVVPPPADDELVGPGSESGITNISPRQNNFWRKTWEIWKRPDGSTYNKGEVEIVVPFYNDITAPADKIVYVGKLPTKNEIAAATSGQYSTVSNGNRTDQGVTINRFRGSFKLVNGSLYTLEWGMPYESPQGHTLAYTQPSWTVKSVEKLGNLSAGGKTYERQMVTYLVTTTFNGQTLNSEGKVEMRKEVVADDRETPTWLGNPIAAYYTRAQAKVGGVFIDFLVFVYQNGVVIMPEGNKAKSAIFAFDEAVANAQGVEKCVKISDTNLDLKNIGTSPKGVYSGYWTGTKWIPAKLTISNEGKSNETWVYSILGGKNHSVMRNEAVALENEAGVKKPAPNPQPQKYEVKEGKIHLYYSRGNRSDTRWDDTPSILK